MKVAARGALGLLLLFSGAPALAVDGPSSSEVVVEFERPVGAAFVEQIHRVMGTSTVKQDSATHFTFHIGPRGNQNDYAVFFAHLPTVKDVSPLPRLAATDHDLPNITLRIALPGAAGSPGPGGRPTPRPQGSASPSDSGNAIFINPSQLAGTHLLVRYRTSGPSMAVINQVYGVRAIEHTEADAYRVTLPPGVNPMLAERMFRLCPYVMQAEPEYGR